MGVTYGCAEAGASATRDVETRIWPTYVGKMNIKLILPFVALAGCTTPSLNGGLGPDVASTNAAPVETQIDAVVPPANAVTVDQFDTTSAADRAAAIAPVAAGDAAIGVTIAALGPPTEPGIWLKTPLVAVVTQGRVVYNGASVNLELRPSGGVAGSGSQISLAAMRLIAAPLTSLPELTVYGP